MTSYKTLYEELKQKLEEYEKREKQVFNTLYLCPLCSEPILEQCGEYYCSSEKCTFDHTPDEIWDYYAEQHKFIEID